MRDILVYLKHIPEYLKSGPWCLSAYVYILCYFTALVYTYEHVSANDFNFAFDNIPTWIPYFRLLGSLYCTGLTAFLVCHVGPLPLASYTLTSWNLLTLRLFTSYLGDIGYEWAFDLSQLALFPSLIGCSVTCLIWWLVLTPLISNLLRKKPKDYKAFWKWNTSFLLLNLHGLILIFASIDFLHSGRHLVPYDLWLGLLVGLLYVLFYLLVLDSQGLHFYIILTPRTNYCIVSYSLVLLTYYGCYLAWNFIIKSCFQY